MCRTLKTQKAKVHYVPYKTSKLKVFFDGGLQLNSIANLLIEVYAWQKLKIFRLRQAACTRFARARNFSPTTSFAQSLHSRAIEPAEDHCSTKCHWAINSQDFVNNCD